MSLSITPAYSSIQSDQSYAAARPSKVKNAFKKVKQGALQTSKGCKKVLDAISDKIQLVEGVEKMSKVVSAILGVVEMTDQENKADFKLAKKTIKSYTDVVDGVQIFGRIKDWKDWIVARKNKNPDRSKNFKVASAKFGKLTFLTVGNFFQHVNLLHKLKIIDLGKMANTTFKYKSVQLPGVSLFADMVIGIASGFSIADNSLTIRKLRKVEKAQKYSLHIEKWTLKKRVAEALAKGENPDSLMVGQRQKVSIKDAYLSNRTALGSTKDEANAKWEKLINVDKTPESLSKLLDLRKWKLKVWKIDQKNNRLGQVKSGLSITYDVLKISLIASAIISAFICPVASVVFVSVGMVFSTLGLVRLYVQPNLKKPQKPIPTPNPVAAAAA